MTDETSLPTHWSASARTTYAEVTEEHPNLDAATLASVYECCELLSSADAMHERVAVDGLVVQGSKGQPVAHPLLSEERLSRSSALQALRALGLARGQSPASAAGAALAARRHHGRTDGVRSGR